MKTAEDTNAFVEAQQYADFILKGLNDNMQVNEDGTVTWRTLHDHPERPTWDQYTDYPTLLLCPFCGSEAKMKDFGSHTVGWNECVSSVGVECTKCNTKKGVADRDVYDKHLAMLKAIEIWNNRV